MTQTEYNEVLPPRSICLSNHCTKMSDELLGNVHPFEKLLKEAVGKTLLNGGNVLLHVLQSPEGGRTKGVKIKEREKNMNYQRNT